MKGLSDEAMSSSSMRWSLWSRHMASAIWRTTNSADGLRGPYSSVTALRWASYALGSSDGRKAAPPERLCLDAFWDEVALPSSERGPVDLFAFARLASR